MKLHGAEISGVMSKETHVVTLITVNERLTVRATSRELPSKASRVRVSGLGLRGLACVFGMSPLMLTAPKRDYNWGYYSLISQGLLVKGGTSQKCVCACLHCEEPTSKQYHS